MKKLLMICFTIALFVPLYAQEEEFTEYGEYETSNEIEEKVQPIQRKAPVNFARRFFELGIGGQAGVDNGLFGARDLFKENIVIDLNKIESSIRDDGVNINADGEGTILYLDIKNLQLINGLWDLGFSVNASGKINVNIPKSILTLVTKGNIDQHSFEGMISASGGVYADAGLNAVARYGMLRIGFKPALFTPLLFIPKSGIKYYINTEDAVDVETSGEIIIYSPLNEDNNFTGLKFGFDVSLDGEYTLFPFLDIGGAFYRIPIVPATLQNRMILSMGEVKYHLDGKMIMEGNMGEVPDFGDFDDPVYDTAPYKVFRPFRFDVYARYKPLSNEMLVVRPNIGFSVDGNEKKAYFNAGLDLQSTLARNLIKLYLGTSYRESVWRHRFGFAVNLRAFELGLEGALRADSFVGSFRGQGYSFGVSTRFGW